MTRRITSILTLSIGIGLFLAAMAGLAGWPVTPAAAAPLAQESATPQPASPQVTPAAEQAQPTPAPTRMPNLSIGDDYCLGCHGQPGQTLKLENGEELDLFVDPALHKASVHGEMGYACVQCHTTVGEYPHPPFQAADRRDVTLKLTSTCEQCHQKEASLNADGVHAMGQKEGIREAAVCVDCHTSHEVRRLNDPVTKKPLPETRQWIPERCALCHNAIYQKYKESVHGAALSEGNPDVPTCIDCHGVHNIENPTTAYFRLNSPETCSKCHTDPEITKKYNLNPNVLNSYVSDFHGSTVAIFEKLSPNAQVNKPVCYDCHGVHDISSVKDPHAGLDMQENLLKRCQVCHPDANPNFPTAWMSHYSPSPEHYPLVYYVNLFYLLFIPGVLGGMAILVVMDASRMVINRRKQKAGPAEVFASSPASQPEAQTGDPSEIAPAATQGADPAETTPGDADEPESSEPPVSDSEAEHD
jgi:hypothetical protein